MTRANLHIAYLNARPFCHAIVCGKRWRAVVPTKATASVAVAVPRLTTGAKAAVAWPTTTGTAATAAAEAAATTSATTAKAPRLHRALWLARQATKAAAEARRKAANGGKPAGKGPKPQRPVAPR